MRISTFRGGDSAKCLPPRQKAKTKTIAGNRRHYRRMTPKTNRSCRLCHAEQCFSIDMSSPQLCHRANATAAGIQLLLLAPQVQKTPADIASPLKRCAAHYHAFFGKLSDRCRYCVRKTETCTARAKRFMVIANAKPRQHSRLGGKPAPETTVKTTIRIQRVFTPITKSPILQNGGRQMISKRLVIRIMAAVVQ